MTDIIALAGPIGAGKSAVADRVARLLGAPRRSFGGVVRERALELGIPTDREVLQTLGDEIIATEGWEAFCRAVVGDTATTVVVDGVRHIGAVDGLARIAAGGHFALVFVEAGAGRRRSRVAERDGTSHAELDAADAHPNERQVPLVRKQATLVVVNDIESLGGLDALVDRVVSKLRLLGFAAAA